MIHQKLWTMCGRRPRAEAVWVEGAPEPTIEMRYPCGYTKAAVVSADKSLTRIALPLLRRWTTPGGYWTKTGNHTGVEHECPRCRRRAQAEARKEKRP